MIAEDLLERGLGAAAESYEIPPAAVDDLRDQLAPRRPQARRRLAMSRRAWVLSTAAAAVGVIALAVAVGGGPNGGPDSGSSAGKSAGGTAIGSGTASGVNGVAGVPAPAGAGGSAGAAVTGGVAGHDSATGAAAAVPGPSLQQYGASTTDGQSLAGKPARTPAAPAGAGAKVVKTGELDLQVDKGQVAHTLDQISAIATVASGFVAESHTNEGGDPSGSITLRVPVARFEAAVHDVRQLHAKVLSQQTSGVDVTSSYVDLQARIRALVATRSAFERLLARATTIGDTLAVQSRITDVQTQIEQLQGQLRVLDDQSSYGTLTVTVDQKLTPAPPAHHRSGMSAALHRSVDRFVNGIEAIVGILGPLLLVLLLVALAFVVGRVGYRLLRRQLV